MTTRGLVAPRRAGTWLRGGLPAVCLSALLLLPAEPVSAQLISIQTVPVAQGERVLGRDDDSDFVLEERHDANCWYATGWRSI